MVSYLPRLLKLAGPMILSSSAITLMQIIDALVLSRHSSAAVAAMGPASMAVILVQGFLFGTAGYAGTFVAHNHGRGDRQGVLRAAWIGIQTALVAGCGALLLAWPLARLFSLAGHAPQVMQDEMSYFLICVAGSLFPVLGAALSGWLSGIGRPVVVTAVTFISFGVNAVLAWGLVLGAWGLPRLGIAGAACATVLAQALAAVLYLLLFVRAGGLADKRLRCFNQQELREFLTLSMPFGVRISGELLAWTLFLVVVGRLGTVELAASSIAFRINGLAFFPALGLGQAAGVLVGQARGAGRDHEVPAIAWQSLAACEVWMLIMAVLYATAAEPLVACFAGEGPDSGRIVAAGTLLLHFVAVYCIFDAANIMIGCVLASAGETRWIARAFFSATCIFLVLLWLIDRFIPGLAAEWTLATAFVFTTALVWLLRFRTGAWRGVQLLRTAATSVTAS